jgi:ureidoacrylate peracid hydrolase
MKNAALMLLDLQNDFLHPKGAYGRGGLANPEIGAVTGKMKPLVDLVRAKDGLIGATLFTLVTSKGGEPIVSAHLKKMRPFLAKGDFVSGSWGQQVVDELAPADFTVEKIAYSAFYMSRLEWLLRHHNIKTLYCAGIVTNGGVASTVRDAHVREFECVVLEDGCAAFSPEIHRQAIDGLRPVARIATIAEAMKEFGA